MQLFIIYHFTISFQKRQLSAQSLAFNLKDKVFCELFPDVVDVRMSSFQMSPPFFFVFHAANSLISLLPCIRR